MIAFLLLGVALVIAGAYQSPVFNSLDIFGWAILLVAAFELARRVARPRGHR